MDADKMFNEIYEEITRGIFVAITNCMGEHDFSIEASFCIPQTGQGYLIAKAIRRGVYEMTDMYSIESTIKAFKEYMTVRYIDKEELIIKYF